MAILLDEIDATSFAVVLTRDSDVRLSAMTDYEARVCDAAGISIESFGPSEAMLAFDAYRRFGKGNHPARLNLGDCAAYALARSLEARLLFKGSDFARTDIRRAL